MAKVISKAKEIKELEAKKDEAFQALMKFIAPANEIEAIALFVQATHNSWKVGWKQGWDAGYDTGNGN